MSLDLARAAKCARLDAMESAATFRTVLDAMARPGLVVRLPAGVRNRLPPVLAPLLMLADVDVNIHIVGGGDPATAAMWRNAASTATGARITELDAARLVAALDRPSAELFAQLCLGTASQPELGAMLALPCDWIATAERAHETNEGVTLSLSGPGIDASRTVVIGGIDDAVVEGICSTRGGFPAGVDVLVIATDGSMAALPRSTQVSVNAPISTPQPQGAS